MTRFSERCPWCGGPVPACYCNMAGDVGVESRDGRGVLELLDLDHADVQELFRTCDLSFECPCKGDDADCERCGGSGEYTRPMQRGKGVIP